MRRRQESGEKAHVRRQRQRRDGGRLVEHHTFTCEPLEMRHRGVHETVRRQAIRTSGVERDQQNAWGIRPVRSTAEKRTSSAATSAMPTPVRTMTPRLMRSPGE